ncbi:oligosaccharide flippase family protein [Pseudomonas sp. NPDC079086]|uniref:oligosaccharide flippase family protein n=1 Tax=unclassified Pseudomonas TaxID=196821 RepID=UPI0037C574BC
MLARAVRAPLWLLVSALMARVMGPEGLGVWAMLMAAGMLFNQVFVLWSQSITQRFGRLEWESSRQLKRTWAIRWPLLLVAGTLALVFIFLAPANWLSAHLRVPQESLWLVLPLLLSLWLMGEVQGLQQVRERYLRLAWSPLLADLVLIGVLVALSLAAVFGQQLSTSQMLVAVSFSGLATWVLLLSRELKGISIGWQLPEVRQLRVAIVFALPLLPGYMIGYLSEWCDYLLIGHFIDSQAVGLYHPAFQYMLILIGIPTAVVAVLMPQLVSRIDQLDSAGEIQLIERVAPQIMSLWGIATIGLIAFLPAVFSLLIGHSFDQSRILLQVLLAAVPGAAATHLYGLAHFAQGRLLTANVALFGVKLLVNVSLTLILLPIFGVLGAAIAAVIGFLLVQWLFLLDQHRHLKLPISRAALSLFLAHAGGLALVAVDTLVLRSLISVVVVFLMLFFIRRGNLFSPRELSAMVPGSLGCIMPVLARMLCKNKLL